MVKLKRKGNLIGYSELRFTMTRPSSNNEVLLYKDFDIKMIDSTRRLLLGRHEAQGLNIQLQISIKMKLDKSSSLKDKNEHNHSYRNHRIKALSPKIEKNFILIKNFSTSLENELLLIKTPPNNLIKKNNIFNNANQYTHSDSTLPNHVKKKCINQDHSSFMIQNDSSINNNNNISMLLNTNNDQSYHNENLLLTPIEQGIDSRIREMAVNFLMKYNDKGNMSNIGNKTTPQMRMKTMVSETFNYIKAANVAYKESIRVRKRMTEELLNANEDYLHIIKVNNALNEYKNRVEYIRVSRSPKCNEMTQLALNSKKQEGSIFHSMLNALIIIKGVLQLEKPIEKERSEEHEKILEKMTTDEKSIVLLLTIKSIIANYGKISILTPIEHQSKLHFILRLYDIKEKEVRLKMKSQNCNKAPYTLIGKITEQEDEEDDDDEEEKYRDKKSRERDEDSIKDHNETIKRILLSYSSKIPFCLIKQNLYSYGSLNVKAVYDNGQVKISIGDDLFSLDKFIKDNENSDEVKSFVIKSNNKPKKAFKAIKNKRNITNYNTAVKSC